MTRAIVSIALMAAACQPGSGGDEETEALLKRAEAAEDRCAYQEAEPDYFVAAELLRQHQPGSLLHRQTLRALGDLYRTLAQHARADEVLSEAMALGGSDSERLKLVSELASLRLAQDRPAEARALVAGLTPQSDEDRSRVLIVKGAIDRSVGRTDEAEESVGEALRLRSTGGELPIARAMNQLAMAMETAGKNQSAESTLEGALNLLEGTRDLPTNCSVEEIHLALVHNLALAYSELGRDDDAVPLYQLVLGDDEARLGADHPTTANTLHNLALSYAGLGQDSVAIPLFEKALSVLNASLGDHASLLIPTLTGLAQSLINQGDPVRAEALLRRAVAIWESEPQEKSVWGANAHEHLGRLYMMQDRDDEAAEHLQRALEFTRVPAEGEPIRALLAELNQRSKQ